MNSALARLSIEKKIGQMLQVRCYGDYEHFNDSAYLELKKELKRYHIGSVVIGMHFDSGGGLRVPAKHAAEVLNQMQRDSELPLLIAADLERGTATRFSDVPAFPWPMAFGASLDSKRAEHFGGVVARDARAIGIHWAFAPVADVNNNPLNPIINVRSFGEDPTLVGDSVAAFIRGARSNGLMVTAKHFPGHGESETDSHRGFATAQGDLEELEKTQLPVFRRAIAADVDAVMPAHVRFPALDPDRIATLSPRILTDLLRQRYGFNGLIVTDALEMQGLVQLYAGKPGNPSALAAVDAIKAGADVISVPADLDAAFNGILNAVKTGEISEKRIDESVRRILGAKARLGLHKSRLVDLEQVDKIVHDPEDMKFAQEVADAAVTLVRDSGSVLPLTKPKDTDSQKIIAVAIAEALERSPRDFEREFLTRAPTATMHYFDGRDPSNFETILKDVETADVVIVLAYVPFQATRQLVVNGQLRQSYGLLGRSGGLLRRILAVAGKKTAVFALGSPYLIESFPNIETYLTTYAMASTSEVSVAKAIFGEIEPEGHLPVTLPGIAARGVSNRWSHKTEAAAVPAKTE